MKFYMSFDINAKECSKLYLNAWLSTFIAPHYIPKHTYTYTNTHNTHTQHTLHTHTHNTLHTPVVISQVHNLTSLSDPPVAK